MKRISYAGGAIVTGDRLADAVMDYAAALARADLADHVRVPALAADESITEFDLLIGPASQLIAERIEIPVDELEDEELVAELLRRSRMVRGGHDEFIGGDR
jgi:hypothetical protein